MYCSIFPDPSPASEPPSKRPKVEEAFVLSEQQRQLIGEDAANKKLWDEALGHLSEGPVCLISLRMEYANTMWDIICQKKKK